MQFIAQLTAISIFILMFVGILSEKFERHQVSLFCGAAMLIIVCGMMTHMCVDTTVRAAMDHGYEVSLVADACATMDLEINGEVIPAETVQKTYIASLAGIFAKIV